MTVLGQGINLNPPYANHSVSSDGRRLVHFNVQSAPLFGNATEMMYYYANLYVGDFDNLSRQALIIDTGSGIMSFPCEGYCTHCGKHINDYYKIKGK